MPTKIAIQTKPLIKKKRKPATPTRLIHNLNCSDMFSILGIETPEAQKLFAKIYIAERFLLVGE
jgi:hypothetical protein